MSTFLQFCATHSRWLLILGLLAGVSLPTLAAAMVPWLPHMVAILMVITAYRLGHANALGALGDLRWSIPTVLVLQLVLPVVLYTVLTAINASMPVILAVTLACAAPTISGGAAIAIILRQDPARMMQLLILGTAAFPITVLPVLLLLEIDTGLLPTIVLRAFLVIFGASAVGFVLRHFTLPSPTPQQTKAMDGATVLFFALIVIGLMAALGPMLRNDPMIALKWVLVAFLLSFGLQAITLFALHRTALRDVSGSLALSAGNRNIALFLVAIPAEQTAPIMIFIACWQLPMYLTPILLTRLYAHVPSHA